MVWTLMQHLDRGDGVAMCGRARSRFVAVLDENGCQRCARCAHARSARAALDQVRLERSTVERVRVALADGPSTAPELAARIGHGRRRIQQVLQAADWAVRVERRRGKPVVWRLR
jgi:hypothetical protein